MSLNTGERGDLAPQQQPLVAPSRPAPAPAPTAPKVIRPGIIQGADGRLSTDIAPPAAATPACASCIDVKRSMASYPCSACTYPNRPHWWSASKGARP
jgi:hypothetical protein